MHRKKISEFLHDIHAIDAIKITEPFFCDASYNHTGKLGTLMVGVCNGRRDTCIPLCTLLLPYPSQYLPLPLLLPLPTTMGAPSISGRVGPGAHVPINTEYFNILLEVGGGGPLVTYYPYSSHYLLPTPPLTYYLLLPLSTTYSSPYLLPTPPLTYYLLLPLPTTYSSPYVLPTPPLTYYLLPTPPLTYYLLLPLPTTYSSPYLLPTPPLTYYYPYSYFVHYSSHHPQATKKSIILGEVLRYKNQCSKLHYFLKLKQNIIEHFLHRGYPIKVIKDNIKKAMTHHPRNTATATDQKVYPFIVTYDCRRPKLNTALTKYLPDLEKDSNTVYMSKNKPIIAYSNLKNLGQLITRSALEEDNIKQEVTYTNIPLHLPQLITKCGQRGCKTCPGLYQKNVFKATTSKKRISIRSRINCNSNNVLQCPICKIQYVGQTRGTLQQRMTHHRNKFNDKTYLPRGLLYKHFDQHLGNFYPYIIPLMTTAPLISPQ